MPTESKIGKYEMTNTKIIYNEDMMISCPFSS